MTGLAFLALFYISTLITTITSFAWTVALQTGKMALLKGSKVPSAVSSMFTPGFKVTRANGFNGEFNEGNKSKNGK